MLVLKERSLKVISKFKILDRNTELQTGPTVFLSETSTLLITFEDLSLSTNIFTVNTDVLKINNSNGTYWDYLSIS